MEKQKAKKIIREANNSELFDQETYAKVQAQVNSLLEEEIKAEKVKIKKVIMEKFNGDYDLAQAFYRKQLAY